MFGSALAALLGWHGTWPTPLASLWCRVGGRQGPGLLGCRLQAQELIKHPGILHVCSGACFDLLQF